MEQSKIKQVAFIINKDISYKFDVNYNVNIKSLKRMLVAAANFTKSGVRVYYNKIEYTNQEELRLDEIAPNQNYVEFYIQPDESLADDSIPLRLGPICEKHEIKYPCFYCYDCAKSICSKCISSNEHINHNTFEKYDYLQHSSILLQNVFQELYLLILSAKKEKKSEFEDVRTKIKGVI
jgi:hypothetical protein